jgi:hypothetical protein
MLIVFAYMVMFNEKGYKTLRKMVGLPYMQGSKTLPAEAPASAEEVAAQVKSINLPALVIVGYGIPAIVLWLMVFKPF